MSKLSEKLADLSIHVGDIEARAEAFTLEQEAKRDAKVTEMRAEVAARQENLQAAAKGKADEIASAWTAFNASMRARAEGVRTQIEAKKDAVDAARALRRADRLEVNAILAIEFAIVAMQDAELAAAEALDARIYAEGFAANAD